MGNPLKEGKDAKLGLVLAGGGIVGFEFEIGALHAFYDHGLKAEHFDIVTGISAGSNCASMYVNGFTPPEIINAFYKMDGPYTFDFSPFKFNKKGMMRKLRNLSDVAPLMQRWAKHFSRHFTSHVSTESGIELFLNVLDEITFPLFTMEGLEESYHDVIRQNPKAVTNFDDLETTLVMSAADMNGMRRIVMGPSWIKDKVNEYDKFVGGVPIPRAAVASGAIPFVFDSIKIGEFYANDGGIDTKANIDLAVEYGNPDYLLILNPVIPGKGLNIQDKGIVTILRQTYRKLSNAPVRKDLKYVAHNPNFVQVIGPDLYDAEMFSAFVMKTQNLVSRGYEYTELHIEKNQDFYKRMRDDLELPLLL